MARVCITNFIHEIDEINSEKRGRPEGAPLPVVTTFGVDFGVKKGPVFSPNRVLSHVTLRGKEDGKPPWVVLRRSGGLSSSI